MAQKVVVELIDDLDGTPIPAGKGESIDFTVDGVGYRIDLGPKNAKAFRKAFDTYLPHATRIGGRLQRRTRTAIDRPHRDPAQTRAIREWAQANVIWSSSAAVFDVRHEVSGSPVLRSGRGYLQSSIMQSLWRDDADCTGGVTGLVG